MLLVHRKSRESHTSAAGISQASHDSRISEAAGLILGEIFGISWGFTWGFCRVSIGIYIWYISDIYIYSDFLGIIYDNICWMRFFMHDLGYNGNISAIKRGGPGNPWSKRRISWEKLSHISWGIFQQAMFDDSGGYISIWGWLPSGKLTYGKSHFFMGKSTINGHFQ